MSSTSCTHFDPNPFKPDLCRTCRKNVSEHPAQGPVKEEFAAKPCDDFDPNPFKPEFCKTCRRAKDVHPQFEREKIAIKANVDPAAVARPRGQSKIVIAPKTTESTATKTKTTTVATPPTRDLNPVVSATSGATLAAAACDNFEPNAFKPNFCRNCKRAKEHHDETAADAADRVAMEQAKERALRADESKKRLEQKKADEAAAHKKEADEQHAAAAAAKKKKKAEEEAAAAAAKKAEEEAAAAAQKKKAEEKAAAAVAKKKAEEEAAAAAQKKKAEEKAAAAVAKKKAEEEAA
eukprot:PhM_4_TR9465/c3_g1_i1/m.56203